MGKEQTKDTEVIEIPPDQLHEINYTHNYGGELYNISIIVSTNLDPDGLLEIQSCSGSSRAAAHFMDEQNNLYNRIRINNYLLEKIKEKLNGSL